MNLHKTNNTEKYIFRINIWVTGFYNDDEIIGRTCIINNKPMIICINENNSPLIINFNEVQQLGKLNFIEKRKPISIPKTKFVNYNDLQKQTLTNFSAN